LGATSEESGAVILNQGEESAQFNNDIQLLERGSNLSLPDACSHAYTPVVPDECSFFMLKISPAGLFLIGGPGSVWTSL
jgi:hypothetical protein